MFKRYILFFCCCLSICLAASAYEGNRGFKHPGGLHTEADFTRIKQQLADGDSLVTAAYAVLCNAAYAQSTTASYPTPSIIRGGTGENYMSAARGATIAYQNALRWKIAGDEDCAKHAVDVLMSWARTTKSIGGDSNYALAAGLYGYQFAQAAELMRDYTGWSSTDFATFQQWMLDVWYPTCISFLRSRNGTWQNSSKWWQCPGHYWSNWGLCNALAVISIGVLCDDVFIYNQGMSFMKYDQVGTFTDPRTANPILNDGLTEFWGNLIVTTTDSQLETGAYGKLGQMQESGRDVGHSALALGLAADIAHVAYNQGDDLFAYMDHRLAAGIEYVAAQCLSVDSLPWTNYHYASNAYYYSDSRSWLMTGPALGAQIRNYWGTIIGHYEGVKGVSMPYAHRVYSQMGIDGGGTGNTSGGYDHMGYSVLMNTRSSIASEETRPTELSPRITCNSTTIEHNELGGLTNTYTINNQTGLAPGTQVTLWAELPEGESNTGDWIWDTGETTQSISVSPTTSTIYRVTYTNQHGVKSEQMFSIALQGDTHASTLVPYINANQMERDTVMYGDTVTLRINGIGGYGTYLWDNGNTTNSITINGITESKDYSATFTNQGGAESTQTFHLVVLRSHAEALTDSVTNTVNSNELTLDVEEGTDVILSPTIAKAFQGGSYLWSNGSTSSSLQLPDIRTDAAGTYTCTYTKGAETYTFTYIISVKGTENTHDITGYLLKNSDLSLGCCRYWSYSFAAYNNLGYQGASYTNGDISMSKFIECWRNKAYIGDGSIHQSLAILPQGKYTLEADAIASWQSDASVTVTGVNLFAGDSIIAVATANGVPEHITLNFTQTKDTACNVGLKTTSCNANWIAVDNFKMTLNGSRYDFLQFKLGLLNHYIKQIQTEGVLETDFQSYYDTYKTLPQGATIKALDAANEGIDTIISKAQEYLAIASPAFMAIKLAQKVDSIGNDTLSNSYAYNALLSYLSSTEITTGGVNDYVADLNENICQDFSMSIRTSASETNPIDMTALIANPNVYQANKTTSSPDGWTCIAGNADGASLTDASKDTELQCYSWSGNASHNIGNRVFYQQLTNLPRGKYILKAATYATRWSARLYASTNNDSTFTTSDFNLNVNTYYNNLFNKVPTTATIPIEVKNDTLYIGVRGVYADYSGYIGGNGQSWRADNFRLYYVGYLSAPGDMDGNGLYTIGDLAQLIHLFDTKSVDAMTADEKDLADVNGDGIVEISDIITLANRIGKR